jgi:hypothetical protein
MSRDFEDKEEIVPASEGDDVASSESAVKQPQEGSRREFLTSLGKWSGAVIGIALFGGAISSQDAEASDEEHYRCWRCHRCHRCWRCRCRCRCW